MKLNKIPVLICVVMVLFASCAPGSEQEILPRKTDSEEVVEISVAYWDIGRLLEQNGEKVRQLENELNIRLMPVDITEENYDSKCRIWAQTNTFPDVFAGKYRLKPQFGQWAKEGLLHEIPENLSRYPALAAWFQKEDAQSCRIEDTLYCIPLESYFPPEKMQLEQTVLYRSDLAVRAGISEEPEEWQEFRRMIKYICEADSQGTQIGGMVAESRELFTRLFLPYYNPLAAVEGVGFLWIQTGPSDYIPAYFKGETPGADMLPVFSLARLMYEEGSIAQDVAFLSGSQAVDSFLHGKSVALCIEGSYQEAAERLADAWKEINGGEFLRDVKALKTMPSMDGRIYNLPQELCWNELYISSSVSDEKMKRIFKLLDRLMEEDGEERFSINGSDMAVCDEVRLKQGRQAQELPSEPLCRQLYLESGDAFEIEVTNDLMDIMTGSEPVQDMWQERMAEYKRNGMDAVILKVNRAVKLYNMGQK